MFAATCILGVRKGASNLTMLRSGILKPATTGKTETLLEDPLAYLPRKPIKTVDKSRLIYGGERPFAGLYVVVSGRVKISRTVEGGTELVTRIASAEAIFGESVLIGAAAPTESALALDPVALMEWSRSEIEYQMDREPRLAIALGQYMVRLGLELQNRLEAMALYKTPERVILALLQLASTLGTPTEGGSIQMPSMTHQLIADYVGTSREIVSAEMNRLRRIGLLEYSRKTIDIRADELRERVRDKISLKVLPR